LSHFWHYFFFSYR